MKLDLEKMPDKNSLQLQYIVDRADKKSAVILTISQFDELFEQMARLVKQAE